MKTFCCVQNFCKGEIIVKDEIIFGKTFKTLQGWFLFVSVGNWVKSDFKNLKIFGKV
jgi:hypothetical protein